MTEAQRLAALIEVGAQAPTNHAAAAELRRLEAECEQLRADAARYRWLRGKVCFTGNNDGTSSMHAINLPDAKGFPKQGEELYFIDVAIDEAMNRGETK